MAISRPVTKTLISTTAWGVPITDEVNALRTELNALKPTAWTALTLVNGWSVYPGEQPMQYRKVGDLVQIRGFIQSGSGGTVCATLPAGFRPITTVALFGLAWNGARINNRLGITTAGAISVEQGLPTEIFGQEFSSIA